MRTIHFLWIWLIFFSCCREEEKSDIDCTMQVIVDKDLFNNGPNDYLSIIHAAIEGDCLLIKFYSSGCDGSSWKVNLIDSEAVAESYPPQRSIRLSLLNEELCDAVFEKEVSFDIRALQTEGNQVVLNLRGWESQLLYAY